MRFVAQGFVKLMELYQFLETSVFIVIDILGIKLILSFIQYFYPNSEFSLFLGSREADIMTSVLTVPIFFIPVITSLLFNYPNYTDK